MGCSATGDVWDFHEALGQLQVLSMATVIQLEGFASGFVDLG